MSSLVFGSLRFDRASIPAELKQLELWPTIDPSALPAERRSLYLQRSEALKLYVLQLDLPLIEIEARTGISRRSFARLFARCLQAHDDGRFQGFRALVPHKRLKSYMRTAAVLPASAGSNASGAFSQLLTRFPSLLTWLDRVVRQRAQRTNGQREVRQDLTRLHKQFLDRCRELSITATEYPFNRDHLGKRSLAAHVRRLLNRSFQSAAADAGASHVGRAWSADIGLLKKPVTRPFEAVEFDGHKIDVRLAVRVIDPFGFEMIYEIDRIWILVVIEIATRAALGYSLALGREYTKNEVVMALQAALTPHRRRELTIPGLTYSARGGMPSEVMPEIAYACWDWFRGDNARAHLSEHTLTGLVEFVGCWPDFGQPGEPNERPYVERFFGLLASHLSHRLPGTTGSNPQDIRRRLGDVGDRTRLLVRLDELEQLIDVMMCDYNGEPRDGLGGRTSLEAMRHFLAKGGEPIRTLAVERRDALLLLQELKVVPVRGNLSRGVRPHINFTGARYSSDVLCGNAALIGRRLRIYFNPNDVRTVRAYFENGDELGVLIAARPWCFTSHSLRIRREILRLREQGKLHYREGEDAVEAWVTYKRKQARRSKRAASDLARLVNVQRPEPLSTAAVGTTKIERAADRGEIAPITGPLDHRGSVRSREASRTARDPKVKPMRIRKAIVF